MKYEIRNMKNGEDKEHRTAAADVLYHISYFVFHISPAPGISPNSLGESV